MYICIIRDYRFVLNMCNFNLGFFWYFICKKVIKKKKYIWIKMDMNCGCVNRININCDCINEIGNVFWKDVDRISRWE